jgi:FAD dependent oxidoreductase TIGR03364
MTKAFDVGIVGAGIVGLAHAYLAARAGRSVVVFDRDHQANGASVRNFGFVTVTGQSAGDTWRRALYSRDVWAEVADAAGIEICHRGMIMLAHSDPAADVLAQFAAHEMGQGCTLLDRAALKDRHAYAHDPALVAGLVSPHELRVNSRTAIPRLAAFLAERYGVVFQRPVAVTSIGRSRVQYAGGETAARYIVVCPGHDYASLYPEVFARHPVRQCKLQMLRLSAPAWRLNAAVMSDLGLLRYGGYGAAASLDTLRATLQETEADALARGIHLIVVQNTDGSLVVGDSHDYAPTTDDVADEATDDAILAIARRTLDLAGCRVLERWVGVYGSSGQDALIERVDERVAVVAVTSGTGASTAFGLAVDCFKALKIDV